MARTKAAGIKTIFAATDFSETADLALRHAVALARRHGARLVLGHFVEPLPVAPYPVPMASVEEETRIREIEWQRLDDLGNGLRSEGVVVETQLDVGPSGPGLVEMAKKADADLLVIGTRGLSGLKHLVLGSTAEHVVRRAHCPVLTIHPEDREVIEGITRIVVPTDLSEDAAQAIEAFGRLFAPDAGSGEAGKETRGISVELVFADSTPPYLEAMSHERLEKYGQTDVRREELEAALAPVVERLRSQGFEVVLRVLDGGPVEVITEEAEAFGADLIVMSTHGRSALVNALLGRTAQRVVQHASCPVFTVCPRRRLLAGIL